MFSSVLLSPLLNLTAGVSSSGPLYTVDSNSNFVYSVDLQTGSSTPLLVISGNPELADIALLNRTTAYTFGSTAVYRVNLVNNTYEQITQTAIPGFLEAIAIANNETAYLVGGPFVYSLNLVTGDSSVLADLIEYHPGLTDIAIANDRLAYVTGYNSNEVYAINLVTGGYTQVTSTPVGYPGAPGLTGIGLMDMSTAYVIGFDGALYVVDLETGDSSPVGQIEAPYGLFNLGIDGDTGYTISSEAVYAINLLQGTFLKEIPVSGASDLYGAALLLQMPSEGLSGNNLTLSTYLNDNAPIDVIRSFALLDEGLASALESASPGRNTFTTYASQNAYLASSQVLTDHSRQKRFHDLPNPATKPAIGDVSSNQLFVSADDTSRQSSHKQDHGLTLWVSPFGEYTREKAQNQTPAFQLAVGGVVIGLDKTLSESNMIGLGGSYVFTHVYDKGKAGHANINQGFVTLYGTSKAAEWHFDLGIWGGYYASRNQRRIAFSGLDKTAHADIKGWQLAPHLEVGYEGFWQDSGCVKWFGMEPFLTGDWVANWEKDFQEYGAENYNMGQDKRFCSLLRAEAGLRLHETLHCNWGRLVFSEKASYAYQKAFHTGRISAFLVGSPGSFTVDTLTGAQNLGVFEFSMLFMSIHTKMPYVDIRYQGEFGSHYQSHQGIFELGRKF